MFSLHACRFHVILGNVRTRPDLECFYYAIYSATPVDLKIMVVKGNDKETRGTVNYQFNRKKDIISTKIFIEDH